MDKKIVLQNVTSQNITPIKTGGKDISSHSTIDVNTLDKAIITNNTDAGSAISIITHQKEKSKVEKLKSFGEELKKEKAVPDETIDLLVLNLQKTEPLTGKELKVVAESEKQIRALHKSLHDKIKKGDRTQVTVRTLQATHLFMDICKQIKRDAVHERRSAIYDEVTKDMPASIKNNPVYKTFFESTNISKATLKNVLNVVQSLDNLDSTSLIKGNKISVLTRELMWQTKMNLLDKTINEVQKGSKAQEIDFEYYELSSPDMLERIEKAAKLGSPIRGVLDPGRFTTLKGKNGDKIVDASEVIRKTRMASYFQEQLGKYDVGICLYPVVKKLGSAENLMHRKLLRTGDTVILSGMNANSGSGENVDIGKQIEGPAAKRLAQIFKKDVDASKGALINDIFDVEYLALLKEGKVRLDASGIIALLEIYTNSQNILSTTVSQEDLHELLNEVKKRGIKIETLANWPDSNNDKTLNVEDVEAYLLEADSTPESYLSITPEAGQMIAKLLEKTIERLNNTDNQNKLAKISMPDSSTKGEDVMSIADTSYERIAILLKTIASAEKFIYVQSFVLTQLVAKMIHTRKEELKSQGKELEAIAIADTGIYPGGGSPNQDGMLTMENMELPARWALLERTDPKHARKIHAKEIITDILALSGSTNLSQKGLTKNHEMGDITFWRQDDPRSLENKQKAINDILLTLNKESININTKMLADKKFANTRGKDVEIRKEEYRKTLTYFTLQHIDRFGKEYAKKVIQPLLKDPLVWEKIQVYRNQGMSKGYSILKAVHEVVPEEKLNDMKEALPTWKTLKYFAETGSTPEYDAAKESYSGHI